MTANAPSKSAIPERVRFARLISLVHAHPETAAALLEEGWIPAERRAHVVGITGSTAVGKSTLIDKIIGAVRKGNRTVIVLAIDPTQEESGGAVLGDTIRMRDHYLDDGVFLRSFASRGAPSALTPALKEVIGAVSRFADVVVVETAGAGQGDTGIRHAVDTLVVLPETRGDIINLLKAGPHEYADVFAVNIRTEEDDRFLSVLKGFASTLERSGWRPPVFRVNAKTGEGVPELVRHGIYTHHAFLNNKKSP